MGKVNIKGLDKVELLRRLWNNSHCQGMSFMGLKDSPIKNENMTYDDAKKVYEYYDKFDKTIYMDYVYGHIMKIAVGGDETETRLYNRDVGENAAEKIIEKLRKETEEGLDVKVAIEEKAMTREEHLDWCKKRAETMMDRSDPMSTYLCFIKDMSKHDKLKEHPALEMGAMLYHHRWDTVEKSEVLKFIREFN